MSIEKITTGDGSHTLYSAKFDEIYHSRHGAIAESKHVFVKHGLEATGGNTINVFEVGFGTGLNAFLAYLFATESNKQVNYEGVELYPIDNETATALNYADSLAGNDGILVFNQLHTLPWDMQHSIGSNFSFKKIQTSILEYMPTTNYFDVIFFDAFAPTVQTELWSVAVFAKMLSILKEGGRLSTYCSKGDVRRAMQEAGFKVEKHQGPPGKREMLVGIKG